jgi:hypothetical protein
MAPVCETRQITIEYVLQWVSTSKTLMTVFKYTYEQWLNAIIDEVNDC